MGLLTLLFLCRGKYSLHLYREYSFTIRTGLKLELVRIVEAANLSGNRQTDFNLGLLNLTGDTAHVLLQILSQLARSVLPILAVVKDFARVSIHEKLAQSFSIELKERRLGED